MLFLFILHYIHAGFFTATCVSKDYAHNFCSVYTCIMLNDMVNRTSHVSILILDCSLVYIQKLRIRKADRIHLCTVSSRICPGVDASTTTLSNGSPSNHRNPSPSDACRPPSVTGIESTTCCSLITLSLNSLIGFLKTKRLL